MPWPRLVVRPPAGPAGEIRPVGNGLAVLARKVRPLSSVAWMGVDWLNPVCSAGEVLTPMVSKNMPYPDRMIVVGRRSQAKPIRGMKLFDSPEKGDRSRPPLLTNVTPPNARNWLTGNSGIGLRA